MYGALQASMHVLIDHVSKLELLASRQAEGPWVAAVLSADCNRMTISGPPEQVASVLRALADKVDAVERNDEGGR
jgi:hypothetical protein